MEFKYLIFALVISVLDIKCEENKKPTNPIINLFEAPLKALRTRPGEAVAIFEPQVVKSQNGSSSWYPGQAIGNAANSITNWISQNTPLGGVLTTTTPAPDVIVQVQSAQGSKKTKRKKQPTIPDLNQLLQGDDDDDDDEDEQSDDDENDEEDEKQFEAISRPNAVGNLYRHGFRNGIRNEARYGPGMPYGNRYRIGIKNRYTGQGQFGPNQFFDPNSQFYGPPRPQMYFGPLAYRPPVKRRRTAYNRRRPYNTMTYSKPKRKPVQVVLSPEMGGQLPLLIPVQTVSLNSMSQKKKKKVIRPMRPIITQNDHIPELGFTYVPIPLAQVNLGNLGGPSMDSIPNMQSIPSIQSIPGIQSIGVDTIPVQQIVPQLQIVAQHTHTINQEPQIILSDELIPSNQEIANRPNRPSRPGRPERPTKSSRPSRPHISTRQPRPTQSDPWAETGPQHKFDPNRHKPVIVRISPDQSSFNRPDVEQEEVDSYSGDYNNMPNPFISIGGNEDDDEESEIKNEMQGRSEPTSQYYIPQKYFPLLGSDSYLAVSNNGRFLLKTGRDLKIERSDGVKEETDNTSVNENVTEIIEENGNIDKVNRKPTPDVQEQNESDKLENLNENEYTETIKAGTTEASSAMKTERSIETIEVIPKTLSSAPLEGNPGGTASDTTHSLRTANLVAKPQVLLKEDEIVKEDIQSDVKSILGNPSEAVPSNSKVYAARSHAVPRGGLKYKE